LLWVIVMTQVAVGCTYAGSSEGIVKEIRPVAPFSKISVSTGISVFLTQGNEHYVEIEADESVIENVMVETKDGKLKIYYKASGNIFRRNKSMSGIKVFVTFTRMEELAISSGSRVVSQNQFVLEDLEVKCSSGASCKLDIVCDALALKSSSGASINIKGQAKSLDAGASSGASISGGDLVALVAKASSSSGASVKINVSGESVASASSGGSVTIHGDGVLKSSSQSSGGSVSKR
jgi:hypothetical protein